MKQKKSYEYYVSGIAECAIKELNTLKEKLKEESYSEYKNKLENLELAYQRGSLTDWDCVTTVFTIRSNFRYEADWM